MYLVKALDELEINYDGEPVEGKLRIASSARLKDAAANRTYDSIFRQDTMYAMNTSMSGNKRLLQ
jgi:hypothetical protein